MSNEQVNEQPNEQVKKIMRFADNHLSAVEQALIALNGLAFMQDQYDEQHMQIHLVQYMVKHARSQLPNMSNEQGNNLIRLIDSRLAAAQYALDAFCFIHYSDDDEENDNQGRFEIDLINHMLEKARVRLDHFLEGE
ncbi:hypothetical protein HDU85_006550 [Gaertneriomyces sp. JEL0708]|nr:hypothetical protein HDU85_006550 [Gaertneriomyces sp. JEL0708]